MQHKTVFLFFKKIIEATFVMIYSGYFAPPTKFCMKQLMMYLSEMTRCDLGNRMFPEQH